MRLGETDPWILHCGALARLSAGDLDGFRSAAERMLALTGKRGITERRAVARLGLLPRSRRRPRPRRRRAQTRVGTCGQHRDAHDGTLPGRAPLPRR